MLTNNCYIFRAIAKRFQNIAHSIYAFPGWEPCGAVGAVLFICALRFGR